MDFDTAIRIAASGMSANKLRLNLLTSNLANAQTTRSENGGPYQRRDAVFRTSQAVDSFEQLLSDIQAEHANGVEVTSVIKQNKFREVYDPSHPDSNDKGYVLMPDINVVEEMVDMLATSRSYEANVQAIKALKAMANQALNIG